MKVHSYLSVNGNMQWIAQQSKDLLHQLRATTNDVGGWEKALALAEAHQVELDSATQSSFSSDDYSEATPSGTPHIPHGTSASYMDASTAMALRKRLAAVAMESAEKVQIPDAYSVGLSKADDGKPIVGFPHPLVYHPDERVSSLAKVYSEVQRELVSTGPHYVVWPNNISLKNFAVYQLIPSLVYELEYPRTDRCAIVFVIIVLLYILIHPSIRPLYIFEKTVSCASSSYGTKCSPNW